MKETDYTPVNADLFKEMLHDARRAEKKEHLETYTICWIFSLEYPRADICAVLNIVEHEKGWRS